MNRSRHSKNRSKSSGLKPRASLTPIPFNACPTFTKTFRFKSTSVEAKGADEVGARNLIGLLVSCTTAGSVGTSIIGAARLKRVRLYGAPAATGFTTASVTFGGANTPDTCYSDTGTFSRPAHVDCVPPKDSVARFWWQSAAPPTVKLLDLEAPAGSVCDVVLEFQLQDTSASSGALAMTGVPGAVPGTLYHNYLDASAPTGGAGAFNWQPVSQASVFGWSS